MKSSVNYGYIIVAVLCFSLVNKSLYAAEPNEFAGMIEPFETVNVGTPSEGVVERVLVQRSAVVKQGEPLVNLESSVESSTLERARKLAAVDGEIKLQEERLVLANSVGERTEELFQADAISTEKRDEAATEVKLAKSRLKKANEDRTLAQLDLERAKAVLGKRTIHSPISGVVVERLVAPGEYVNSQPLLKLAQLDPLRVELILPAALFRQIKTGMKAEVKPEIQPEETTTATVTIVDRVIDPASGTFGVRLELPNPDYRIPGGLKCTVRFLDLLSITGVVSDKGKGQSETKNKVMQ